MVRFGFVYNFKKKFSAQYGKLCPPLLVGVAGCGSCFCTGVGANGNGWVVFKDLLC